ncbi:hypothetical protein GQ42DRAFT_164072 [Ramicandelaber brevisporus]|nr:hypothetical protein GQ42DRAFT_164072 [Ramicandelaber brevisporus]
MLTASPMLSFGNINRGVALISCTVIIFVTITFTAIVSLALSIHPVQATTFPHSAITDN